MKHANKIVALLLCLTLLVSAMAIFVSAAETEADPETEATQAQSVAPTYTTEWPATETNAETAAKNTILSPVPGNDANNFNINTFNGVEGDYEYAVHTFGDNKFMSMDRIPTSASNAYFDIYAGGTRSSHKVDTNYTIVQFDAAYFGTLSGTINPLFRSSAGPNAYSINNTVLFNGVTQGQVAQFTFVFYYADGKGYNDIYRDGVKLGTYGGLTVADPSGTYADCLRVYFNECYMVFDNVYACHSATNPAVDGVLANEYSQFDNAEYTKLAIPSIVSVNGVEYNNVTAASAALVYGAEVEFLAQPWESDDKLVVACNATINTNGFVTVDDLDLTDAHSYAVNGNVIKVIVPNYVSSKLEESSSGSSIAGAAIKSPAHGNGATTVLFANTGAGEYFLYETDGNSFITAAKPTTAADSYIQLRPEGSSSHKVTNYPYLIIQYDAAYLGATPTGSMRPTDQLPGTVAPIINNATLFADMAPGEVAQFTFVFYATQNADDPDTTDVVESNTGTSGCYVYRNGVYCTKVTGWAITNWSTAYHNQLRGYQSTSCPIAIDNLYAKHFAADPRLEGANGVFDFGQYEDGNFVSYNQFNDPAYEKLVMPAIAAVNGVEYNTVKELNAALASCDTTANVEFLHDYIEGPAGIAGEKVAVTCNAVINTNGFITADDLVLSGNHSVDGNVIKTVYWETAGNVTTDQLNAILKSPVTTNKGVSSGVNSNYTFTRYITASDRELVSVKKNTGSGNVSFSFTTSYFKDTSYTMVQFESGYLGTLGTDSVTILFNAGGGNTGTSYRNDLIYKDMKPGEIAQFTFVFYIRESAQKIGLAIYRNGELLSDDANKIGVISDWGDPTGYRISGFRITSGATEALYSNMYVYHTNEDPRVLDIDGRYTFGEYDQFQSEEFVSAVPAFATVDGVDYNNVDRLNYELAKYYKLSGEMEFHYDNSLALWGGTDKIIVNRSVNIDTNGFVTADDFTLPANHTVKDGIISAHVPNNKGVTASGNDVFSGVVKSNMAGNAFNSNFNADESWNVVTTPDGNQYVDFHTKGSDFKLQMDLAPGRTYGDFNDYPTMVVQYELIKTGEISTGMNQTFLIKTDGQSGYTFTGAVQLHNLLSDVEYGELAQISIVMHADDATNTAYIRAYANGVLKYSGSKEYTEDEFNASYWYGYRMLYCEVTDVDEDGDGKIDYSNPRMGANVLLDNVYYNYFAAGTEGIFDEKYRITDEYSQFARADHKKLELPVVALVDGEAVGYEDIDALLADGANHEVELLHQPLRELIVQSDANIKTNGYTEIKAGNGYLAKEANGIITVTLDERKTNIKITLDGQLLTTIEDTPYAYDHESLIRAQEFENAHHDNSVYFKDGKYYELVWDFSTKPEYAEEITYEATLQSAVILVVDIDNQRVVHGTLSYDENGVLTDGLRPTFSAVYYFNEDVNSTAYLCDDNVANNITWELNGHTYNYTPINGDVHGFTTDSTDRITVKNGTIQVNGGNAFIYAVQGTTPTATFEDVSFDYINANLTDWRGGTLNFESCTLVDPHIALGARPSVATYINLNNCTINTQAKVVFAYHNNDGFNYEADSLANVDRHVRVTNSSIYMRSPEAALVSMPKEECIKLEEGEVNNRLLYLENTIVYAYRVYQGGSYEGTVSFGEGVKYAFGIYAEFEADKIAAAEGVKLGVKTNDMTFSYLATADYQTVNWASGLVELWETGATPVASDPADKATEGTAGGYTLTANLTLHADIFFNIYADGATLVTINGKTIEGVDGKYAYELLPASALGDIYVAITFADGSVYTRATTLMEYVNKSAADTSYTYNAQLVQVYANMLQYLLDVQLYEGFRYAQADANAFLSAHAATSVAVENTAISENIGTYFASATFQLDGEVKLVLTLQDGVTVDAVTVGDVAVEPIAVDGKLYVEIPAYLLTETVEVTIGEATVEYSLGAYITVATGTAKTVATSLYCYAAAAQAYEAACNAQ